MISAALETLEERGEKRRRLPRKRLRLNVAADAGNGAEAQQVVVHDISVNGLLLESRSPLAVDETITVELPEAPSALAKVVWSSGDFYGCQFARPIPVAAVSASLLMSPVEKSKPPGPAPDAVPEAAAALPAEAAALERLPVFDDSVERGNLASGARIWIVVAIAVGLWFILLKAIGLL